MKKINILLVFSILFALKANSQSKKAIDFTLKNVDNKTVSLNNFKSEKGIILTFVSTVCPVAEMYEQRIQALHHKYAAKGFPVVAIDPVDNFDIMKDTAAARKYTYYFLCDSTQKIAFSYKVKANTHSLLLQNTPKGFIVVYEGAIDDDYTGDNITKKYIENAVDALLNKKAITVKKTRVQGCPIRYRF